MSILTIAIIPILLLTLGLCYYVFKKNSLTTSDREALRNVSLPIAPAEGYAVTLSCMNIKGIYLLIAAVLWTITLVLGLLAIAHSETIPFAPRLMGLLDHLTDIEALKYSPIIFILIFLYLYYHRKVVEWENGLLISFRPTEIEAFEIKRLHKALTYIYLRSKDKTWVLTPRTSEEMRRFRDLRIMAEQTGRNELKVEKLRQNLLRSGAREEKLSGISLHLMIAGLALLLCLVVTVVMHL
ncbi:hypothetical protein [Pedobacter caeni]|uniref:Uncharacterized protein n=1 Tax=Pedobacter caeni TaxID=288992 RepID=A0A1M4WFU2_9SPHI|nr:hypothetical protein [Pedobacter caeni]SHE80118.1 hypothetical protein SAMN04488522_1011255 [Pedobacter caeni]